MTTTTTRKMIAAMQVSLDGFIADVEYSTNWIDSWADAIQLIEDVDMFLLGGKMYPEYGEYWGAIFENPHSMPPMPELPSQQHRAPTTREVAYAQLAATTPHVVLSTTLQIASWPQVQIVRDIAEVEQLKSTPGKNIYVVGGAGLVSSLMDAGLLDELRLIVHSIILGSGVPLFKVTHPHSLTLVRAQPDESGRVLLTYRV